MLPTSIERCYGYTLLMPSLARACRYASMHVATLLINIA